MSDLPADKVYKGEKFRRTRRLICCAPHAAAVFSPPAISVSLDDTSFQPIHTGQLNDTLATDKA